MGKITWAIVMIQDEPWFDEGICLCGAVALRVYVPDHGCLRAYDLLEDGQLKKVQVLGEGERLQVFEWTHLPMSQESYLQFTESILLQHPSTKTTEEWMADYQKQDGGVGLHGWLRPGMPESEVITLLGKPSLREKDALVYLKVNSEQTLRTTFRIPLSRGVFTTLSSKWATTEEILPPRGTMGWALRVIELARDPAIPTGSSQKVEASDLSVVKKLCLAKLKTCKGVDWNDWVSVSHRLHQEGWEEPALADAIAARFLDKAVSVNEASILINELRPAQAPELCAKRLRLALAEAAKPEILQDESSNISSWGDFENLVAPIKDRVERLAFIRQGIVHPHRVIRKGAYRMLNQLPREEAFAAARRGLADSSEFVRCDSANLFTGGTGGKSDLALLKSHLATEKSEQARISIQKAIRMLEEMP